MSGVPAMTASSTETPVTPSPQLCPEALRELLRARFEQLCQGIAEAVNQAAVGSVINASEEQVRDLFADSRLEAYQAAIQMRLDAAQAAFPPSGPPRHRQAAPEQRA